jgi:CheY-like chemotaxis protein
MNEIAAGPESNRPVLIVEDSDDDFESTREALQSIAEFNSPIHRAENGAEAVAYLEQIKVVDKPDANPEPCLILLDLNLPGLHGSKVLTAIKNDERTRHIPVVVFSNSQEFEDVNASYTGGANSFVSKPGSLDELVSTLRSFEKFWFKTCALPKLLN